MHACKRYGTYITAKVGTIRGKAGVNPPPQARPPYSSVAEGYRHRLTRTNGENAGYIMSQPENTKITQQGRRPLGTAVGAESFSTLSARFQHAFSTFSALFQHAFSTLSARSQHAFSARSPRIQPNQKRPLEESTSSSNPIAGGMPYASAKSSTR